MLAANRGVHIVTASLLTFLVLVSVSFAAYFMVSAAIEKGKQRGDVDVLKDSMVNLYSKAKGLQTRREGHTETFTLAIPAGTLRISPPRDLANLTVITKYNHDPGGTSFLHVASLPNGGVIMTMRLPVDVVTSNTVIDEGHHPLSVKVEVAKSFDIGNWTLHANGTMPDGVSSVTGNWYSTALAEPSLDFDLNGDGDRDDAWYLYISDPSEEYVFDTAVVHDSGGNLIVVLHEEDTFRLGGRPLTATTIRERKLVLRYVRVRLSVD